MMYKNTFKLVISNFHLVWKNLVYKFLMALIVVGLAFACALPIINVIRAEGFFTILKETFSSFTADYNIYKLFYDIISCFDIFFKAIATNINSLWLYIVLFLLIIVVVRTILMGFSRVTTTSVLYNYLSSNIKVSYTANLFGGFWKNFKFQLAYVITVLPIDVGIIYCAYMLFKWLLTLNGINLLAPIVLIVLLVFVISLKITFFSCWIPCLITFDCSIFEALVKGVKAVFRRFYRSYSTAILIMFTLIILNVGCALCTFGASLILTLPISSLTILVYNMVVFYSSQGMRFYVDNQNFVTTLKHEETDAILKQKYII